MAQGAWREVAEAAICPRDSPGSIHFLTDAADERAVQAAEKGCFLEKWPEKHPAGDKAHHCFVAFTARLNSCPDASELFIEFFRSLCSSESGGQHNCTSPRAGGYATIRNRIRAVRKPRWQ
jgi:hypothetical protein